jgi:hypothetical protein
MILLLLYGCLQFEALAHKLCIFGSSESRFPISA